MSAVEILRDATKYALLPPHLHGATMHKTLQARLSEDILKHRFNSPFYRTSPGVFFVRELANDPNISPHILNEFIATRRQRSVRRQRILCAPRDLVDSQPDIVRNPWRALKIFASSNARYIPKQVADAEPDLVQLITFTLIYLDDVLLIHTLGAYNEQSAETRRDVVGLRSHVSEFDIDLLNDDLIGVRRNASRELLRFILLPSTKISDIDIISR